MLNFNYYWKYHFINSKTNIYIKLLLFVLILFCHLTLWFMLFIVLYYCFFCWHLDIFKVVFLSWLFVFFYLTDRVRLIFIFKGDWNFFIKWILYIVFSLYWIWLNADLLVYLYPINFKGFGLMALLVPLVSSFVGFFINFCIFLLSVIFLILPILLVIAFYTLSERKVMGAVQRRRGPNVTGIFGLLQPIADGVKLILKEPIIPRRANFFLFFLAPIITFALSFCLWGILPTLFYFFLSDSNIGLLIVFAISSLSIFGIIGAGWASNSKYALLGALRSASQMISYEIALGFIFLSVSLLAESVNLFDIFLSQLHIANFFPLFPLSIIFFISSLAETNRAPFDLPEAEAEIVAGYNVEYSGITFALFFLGEYSNMFLMSLLFVFLFLGGNLGLTFFDIFIFILKVSFIALLFIFVRAILPRVRYDQLMILGWQVFLPFTLAYLLFISAVFFVDDVLYYWHDVNYSLFFQDISKFF